jgi:sec-independent protein translocase protein TatA
MLKQGVQHLTDFRRTSAKLPFTEENMNFLNLKPLEIILILVVVLLLFGAKRLPEMAKGIGQSVREFRKGIKDMKDDIATEAKVEKVEKETEKAG